jgi:tetratricopeptide (TPR) repeat protein
MAVDAELARGYEALEAAMRLGLGAVIELAKSFNERACEVEGHAPAAVFYQLAGDSYLTVYENIRSHRHELGMFMVNQATNCYMHAARLYEACGEVEAAMKAYQELLTCLHSQKQGTINHQNVEVVVAHLSQWVEYCEKKLRQLMLSREGVKCLAIK